MTMRWLTAGESHGPALTAIVEGLPAHIEVSTSDIDFHLARRRLGVGRMPTTAPFTAKGCTTW